MAARVPIDDVLDFRIKRCAPLWSCEAGACPKASASKVVATAPDGTTVTHRYCPEHTPDF